MPDPDFGGGPLDAPKARLVDVLEDTAVRSLKSVSATAGNTSIHIERITDAVPGVAYPRLVEASGRCPPEDVGGPCGYRDFLEAIADPDHEQHGESVAWVGEGFDPAVLDVERLAMTRPPSLRVGRARQLKWSPEMGPGA